MKHLLAATAVALSITSTGAIAISTPTTTTNGNVVDTSFSTSTLLAVDVGFASTASIAATFMLDAADVGGSIGFNSILSEISGGAFQALSLRLSSGASFVLGSLTAIDGSTPTATLDSNGMAAMVTPLASINEIYLGDPLLSGGSDWMIQFAQLNAGDAVTLTITPVPEPSALILLACGLGVLSIGRRFA